MGTTIVLRLLHIVLGALWVGFAVFIAAFLMPSVRAVGPAAGPLMRQFMEIRKMPLWILIAAWLSVISGAFLAWRNAGVLGWAWFQRGPGMVFGIGAVFGISALLIGTTVNAPTGKKIGELGATMAAGNGPPSAEQVATMQRLQATMGWAAPLVAGLALLALCAMSIARYVG